MSAIASRIAADRARLAGVALIGCSLLTTGVHRRVYEAARHGPPQLAEYALALLTIMLASTGILLLIYGAKLFAPPRRSPVRSYAGGRRLDHAGLEAVALDSRHGVALVLARKAIAAADAGRAGAGAPLPRKTTA